MTMAGSKALFGAHLHVYYMANAFYSSCVAVDNASRDTAYEIKGDMESLINLPSSAEAK